MGKTTDMAYEFKPNWELSPVDKLAVRLTLALGRHIPDWPGATDEQLEAVASEIMGVAQSCCCDLCNREIKIDTIVDNDLWREISPTKDEGGLLCAACIADRIASSKTWPALRLTPSTASE